MTTTPATDEYTRLPDDQTLATTILAMEERGFSVGAHKLVATIEDARERVYRHSLPLEDARAFAAYGQNSRVGKILEIHEETPGRIHVVLVPQPIGF
jgi:hypothetical protein